MRVSGIEKGSIARKLGLAVGDTLLAYNGFPFVDILDYEFVDASEEFLLTVQRLDGTVKELTIRKDGDESLGLSFIDDGLAVASCHNRCMFCFVDQLPRNVSLRETLRVKDDDYRHSFLYGSYVTLTNLNDCDIERIVRLKLSPLYISVHSTDDVVRNRLLGIKRSQPILPLIKRLNDAGIRLHTQIVYCPDENEDYVQSALELRAYCQSLAIVPVGLTAFQNPQLKGVSKSVACRVLDDVQRLQTECLAQMGTRFVWAADEFYQKACRAIPASEFYESFAQIDNGVGLVAKFYEDAAYAIEDIQYAKHPVKSAQTVTIATGESAYPHICRVCEQLRVEFGVTAQVYKVQNNFFGTSVTVAGLLSGNDILTQIKDKPLGDRLLLPSVMFRDGSEDFLDNMTLSALAKGLGVTVEKVAADGESFVYAALGLKV